MADRKDEGKPGAPPAGAAAKRRERLASELRANLARRKERARALAAGEAGKEEKPGRRKD